MTDTALIDQRIVTILGRIEGLPSVPVHRFAIGEVQAWIHSKKWPDWADDPGVYFFELDNSLEYVGRALRTLLKERLEDQVTAFGDPKWDRVIRNAATIIGVVPLPPDNWFWAAALEAALIKELRPTVSKRIS